MLEIFYYKNIVEKGKTMIFDLKKIIVTGADGQLGRAISQKMLNRYGIELIRTDVTEGLRIKPLDITNLEEVMAFVEAEKPYAIINCAAFTNVDGCEKDWDGAYKLNAIGPRNLAIAAERYGAKMMHISTDYVFAGNGNKPYTEFYTPNPISAYGKTKLAGEEFVKQFSTKHFIVRTAWLYGDGKNFVKTMLRLSETMDEISVVNDQIGSPTSTTVLSEIIEQLIWTDNYGTFHGTCEGTCSWAEFTEEIFRLEGKRTKVKAITSQEYAKQHPDAAARPAYSVLDNYMLKLTTGYVAWDWKEAIKQYFVASR